MYYWFSTFNNTLVVIMIWAINFGMMMLPFTKVGFTIRNNKIIAVFEPTKVNVLIHGPEKKSYPPDLNVGLPGPPPKYISYISMKINY
jgi:hypothetical protein